MGQVRGRVYYISTGAQTVASAEDLLEITAGTRSFVVHKVIISVDEISSIDRLLVQIKRATSGFTGGSGGGTATETKANTSDTASGLTSDRNNTTQAVAGGGSLETLEECYMNTLTPYEWYPPADAPMPIMQGSQAFIVSIDSPGSESICCTAVVEELA